MSNSWLTPSRSLWQCGEPLVAPTMAGGTSSSACWGEWQVSASDATPESSGSDVYLSSSCCSLEGGGVMSSSERTCSLSISPMISCTHSSAFILPATSGCTNGINAPSSSNSCWSIAITGTSYRFRKAPTRCGSSVTSWKCAMTRLHSRFWRASGFLGGHLASAWRAAPPHIWLAQSHYHPSRCRHSELAKLHPEISRPNCLALMSTEDTICGIEPSQLNEGRSIWRKHDVVDIVDLYHLHDICVYVLNKVIIVLAIVGTRSHSHVYCLFDVWQSSDDQCCVLHNWPWWERASFLGPSPRAPQSHLLNMSLFILILCTKSSNLSSWKFSQSLQISCLKAIKYEFCLKLYLTCNWRWELHRRCCWWVQP